MNCFICHKPVGQTAVSLLDAEIKLHLECFYDDLPIPTSTVYKGAELKNKERNAAIEEKAAKIVEKYLSNK